MNAVLWIPSGTQPMAQILDRPLIQHVVEQLVARGVKRMTLLHGEAAQAAATHLGDGERWGVVIATRLVAGVPSLTDFEAACGEDEPMLFGNAARLCHLPKFDGNAGGWNTLYFDEEDGVGAWSGWGLLPAEILPQFARRITAGEDWRTALRATGLAVKKVIAEHPSLSGETPRDVLMANRRALEGRFPGLFFHGKQKQPGVWVARGAKIAATARVEAPCYVGEDAWIGAACHIGPYTTVAAGSVVEEGTSVTRSVVGEGTFLGPELEVADSYVHHDRIQNVRLGAEIVVREEHVASALSPKQGGGILRFLQSLPLRH